MERSADEDGIEKDEVGLVEVAAKEAGMNFGEVGTDATIEKEEDSKLHLRNSRTTYEREGEGEGEGGLWGHYCHLKKGWPKFCCHRC